MASQIGDLYLPIIIANRFLHFPNFTFLCPSHSFCPFPFYSLSFPSREFASISNLVFADQIHPNFAVPKGRKGNDEEPVEGKGRAKPAFRAHSPFPPFPISCRHFPPRGELNCRMDPRHLPPPLFHPFPASLVGSFGLEGK
jgi:hypothetical protein